MACKFNIPDKYNAESVDSEKVIYDSFCDAVARLNNPQYRVLTHSGLTEKTSSIMCFIPVSVWHM